MFDRTKQFFSSMFEARSIRRAENLAKGVERAGNMGEALGKFGLRKAGFVGVGALAVLGGLAAWASNSRKNAERESKMALQEEAMASLQPIPQMAPPIAGPAVGDSTLMGMAPVAGEHAARVRGGRGQEVGVSNPPAPGQYETVGARI
jgi:hypothetical protein